MEGRLFYIRAAARPMRTPNLYPILLAAGPSPRLGYPKRLSDFGGKKAIEIAVENCAGLRNPIVVLGYRASALRARVPRGVRIVINRKWRLGQLSSLLVGLRRVPRNAAFMLYPVDHVFLTPQLIRRLVRAFLTKRQRQTVVMPRCGGRAGHPVIFSAVMRQELRHARTAREVVYRERQRIRYVSVKTPAIWKDFDTPAEYARSLREFHSERR